MTQREWRGIDDTAGLGYWTHEPDGFLSLAQLERPIPWASPRRATPIHTYMHTSFFLFFSSTSNFSVFSPLLSFKVGGSTPNSLAFLLYFFEVGSHKRSTVSKASKARVEALCHLCWLWLATRLWSSFHVQRWRLESNFWCTLHALWKCLLSEGDSPDSALVRHLTVLSCNTAAYFHVYKPLEKSLKCQ